LFDIDISLFGVKMQVRIHY